jgi:cytoskeleton protein RodZ
MTDDLEAQVDATLSAGTGFGARLRAAREVAELSQAQVAERLHCDPTVVAALEREDLAALGAAVFSRGHLRRYADFLRLPTAELVAQHDQRHGLATGAPDLTRIARAERPRDTNRALRWVYGIGAGLLGLFLVWAVLQRPVTETTTRTIDTASTPSVAAAPPTATTPPADAPSSEVPAAVAGPSAAAAPAASAPAPAPTPVAATAEAGPQAPASSAVRLALTASKDCWTEIYDFEGRQLFFNTARRGSRQEVSGQGPLRVLLGDVAAVKLELAGQEIRIPADLQRKGTAYITIAADGKMGRPE